MKKIVSRNYRNWNSEYKWLVRNEDQPASEAKACRSLKAKGVRFAATGDLGLTVEMGFGCAVVALCDSAEGQDFEPVGPKPIHFDGHHFLIEGNRVEKVAELELKADGSMLAAV